MVFASRSTLEPGEFGFCSICYWCHGDPGLGAETIDGGVITCRNCDFGFPYGTWNPGNTSGDIVILPEGDRTLRCPDTVGSDGRAKLVAGGQPGEVMYLLLSDTSGTFRADPR